MLRWRGHAAAYRVYLNGRAVALTRRRSIVLGHLACGTPYVVAVRAVGAGGVLSPPALARVRTAKCSRTHADLFVAPAGSDANPCTRSAPCATFDRAYHAAKPGETIEVEAGRYPAQTITRAPASAAGPDVVIEAAPDAAVVVTGRLSLGSSEGSGDAPSHLVLRNLTAPKKRVQVIDPAGYITLDDLRAGSFYVDGARHVTIRGGDYGDCGSADRRCEGGGPGSQNWIKDDVGSSRTVDVTIDGATIHDYRLQPGPYHYECLFVLGGTNVTIENSHFYRCELYDIFIQANGPHSIRGVTIQNNWFGRTQQPSGAPRSSAVVLAQHVESSALSDVLVRFNSFAQGQALLDEGFAFGRYTHVRAIGNILGVDGSANCVPAVTYDYNVWLSGACGAHSRNLGGRPMPYVNPSDGAAGDYHLDGGPGSTPADDFVAATGPDYSLAVDRDGRRRKPPRDSGADER